MVEIAQTNKPTETGADAKNSASTLLERSVPYDQPWLTSLLRPVLIAILVACLDLVIMACIARVEPALAGNYVPTILFFSIIAVLLGCITTTFLAQPAHRHRRTPLYRLAEVGLLLAVIRLAIWLVTGTLPTPMEFLVHPLSTLLDGLFIIGGLIVIFSWMMATDLTRDLLRLALQADELYAMQTDRIGEMVRSSHTDRPSILRSVANRWIAGGMLMILLAASLRLGPPTGNGLFALTQQNIQPSVIGAVILYFLTGLLLISQGQLALLRSRWTIDRVPSATNVLRNWPLYVLALILIIGVGAMLLPFGGTFYLAQIVGGLISLVFNTLFGIFQFFMMLLMLLISLITGKEPPPAQEKAAPPPPPPPVVDAQPQVSHLPVWAGGALFWLIMALLLGYAAYIYFSGRGMNFAWLKALWQSLRERWLQWFGAYQQWQMTRVRAAAERADALNKAGDNSFGSWRQSGNLDANQRVRYLYLSLLHAAAQVGLPRAEGETPLQYAPRLAKEIASLHNERTDSDRLDSKDATGTVSLPLREEENSQGIEKLEQAPETTAALQNVQALTDAFIQVRYAQVPVETTEVSRLQQLWEQIKRQLSL
ncbi:MAG: DUF4129 domain-containing protein [Chloroflexi bacterium]|nr:DUF4129 domain-containing protein [Chloroflexota bacterium]